MLPKFNQRFESGFATTIPTTVGQLRNSESLISSLKQNIRTLRRYLTLFFCRQLPLERASIPAGTRRVLWLNPSSSSIGDSLMELSGRCLLRADYLHAINPQQKIELHLLTDRKNADLYREDDVFSQVFQDPSEINACYDLILVDIYNTKSIKIKHHYFAGIPFCSLQGYFYGADFNRMLFSYHRINALLAYPLAQGPLDRLARNYLGLAPAPAALNSTQQLVIAIGGEDQSRTYSEWRIVILSLLEVAPKLRVFLLGSANGRADAQLIEEEFGSRVTNQVAKLSILESAKIIAASALFLGADGGLMHIAEAFQLKGVALFAKFRPELRLSHTTQLKVIYSPSCVKEIKPQQIIAQLAPQLSEQVLKRIEDGESKSCN